MYIGAIFACFPIYVHTYTYAHAYTHLVDFSRFLPILEYVNQLNESIPDYFLVLRNGLAHKYLDFMNVYILYKCLLRRIRRLRRRRCCSCCCCWNRRYQKKYCSAMVFVFVYVSISFLRQNAIASKWMVYNHLLNAKTTRTIHTSFLILIQLLVIVVMRQFHRIHTHSDAEEMQCSLSFDFLLLSQCNVNNLHSLCLPVFLLDFFSTYRCHRWIRCFHHCVCVLSSVLKNFSTRI